MSENTGDVTTVMEPVQTNERIHAIDVLRGFALFGILCVNMQFFTTPMAYVSKPDQFWPEWYNRVATALIESLAAGKFYVLFSFLFGVGLSIQVGRAGTRGMSFTRYHVRRMLVLLGFGMVHAYFIWMGDILTCYAIVGLVMLLFLNRSPLLALGCGLGVYVLGVGLISFLLLAALVAERFDTPNDKAEAAAASRETTPQIYEAQDRDAESDVARSIRIYRSGTVAEIIQLRAREVLGAYVWIGVTTIWMVFAMFTLGFYVGRQGYFERLAEFRPFLSRARWVALTVAAPVGLVALIAWVRLNHDSPAAQLCQVLEMFIGAPALSFVYVSTLLLALTPADQQIGPTVWRERLRPMASMGRMALSNYLMQSVLCSFIFYSYGMGYYARLGPLVGLALTIAIYVIELIWSNWWLRHFRFGPMEWLWRTLTYGKWQPMQLPAVEAP